MKESPLLKPIKHAEYCEEQVSSSQMKQSISPTKQRQGSLVTRWPRLKNSEHAQSVEVIVGVVMGQKSGPAKTGPAVPLAMPMILGSVSERL